MPMPTAADYREVNGTSYKLETAPEVVNVLERVRLNHIRVELHYGDVQTGRDWNETYDVTGSLGRSTGPIKVPILLKTRRSSGGGAILDHCIVKIVRLDGATKGTVLYQHPTYQKGE